MQLFNVSSISGALGVIFIFLRLTGYFLTAPIFSSLLVPNLIKIHLLVALSWVLFPLLKSSLPQIPSDISGLLLVSLSEVAIGCFMGFFSWVTFEAVQLGAHVIGTQIGFGTVSLFDPSTQLHASSFVMLFRLLVLVLMFSLNIHHLFLTLIFESFRVPHWDIAFFSTPHFATSLLKGASQLFIIAVEVALPFSLLALSVNIFVGILSRVIPQMNVMMMSFTLSVGIGLFGWILMAPFFSSFVGNVFENLAWDLSGLLRDIAH